MERETTGNNLTMSHYYSGLHNATGPGESAFAFNPGTCYVRSWTQPKVVTLPENVTRSQVQLELAGNPIQCPRPRVSEQQDTRRVSPTHVEGACASLDPRGRRVPPSVSPCTSGHGGLWQCCPGDRGLTHPESWCAGQEKPGPPYQLMCFTSERC
jgi:hypothetical protein